jgi:hypothetical protein
MTMIAFTTNNRIPVILGDILISSPQSNENFVIPTLGEDVVQYLSPNPDYYPIQLQQKIYILNENVCIAFSGFVKSFKKLLEDLRIYCRVNEHIDASKIENFLNQRVGDPEWKDYSFIILLANRDEENINLGIVKHGQWIMTTNPAISPIYASGSGCEDFVREVLDPAKIVMARPDDDPENDLIRNVLMITKILSRERAQLHTINKHWGAGFEMIYYTSRRFEKVDNIVYVINQGILNEHEKVEVPIPAIVMHYKYHGDVLVITCIRTIKGTTRETDMEYIITSDQLMVGQFHVTPIDHIEDSKFAEDLKDMSFTSYINALGYIFETDTGYYIPASFQRGKQIKVEYKHPGLLEISMEKHVTDQLIDEAKNALFKKS